MREKYRIGNGGQHGKFTLRDCNSISVTRLKRDKTFIIPFGMPGDLKARHPQFFQLID